MTKLYAFAGLVIDSEIELPGIPAGTGEPDAVIRLGVVPRLRQDATAEEEFAFNVVGAAFRITGGREIVVDPRPDADMGDVRVVLLGRVMAFLLRQRGWLPLHASGILIDGQSVLFLGRSGAGKSTTAAAFHAAYFPVVTDDVGAVRMIDGRFMVQPVWARLRLPTESRYLLDDFALSSEFQAEKHGFLLENAVESSLVPLRKIYILQEGMQTRIEPISAVAAAALLSRNTFVKHRRTGIDALRTHLRDCASVAHSVPVSMLIREQALDALAGIVDTVCEDLRQENQAADSVVCSIRSQVP